MNETTYHILKYSTNYNHKAVNNKVVSYPSDIYYGDKYVSLLYMNTFSRVLARHSKGVCVCIIYICVSTNILEKDLFPHRSVQKNNLIARAVS